MSAFWTNAGPTIETKRCLCTSLAYGDFPGVARLYSDYQVRRSLKCDSKPGQPSCGHDLMKAQTWQRFSAMHMHNFCK
jgi:hypothetical protein